MGEPIHKTVESRTGKSVLNAKVALVFYVVNLLLQFFSRKIFLDYLGAEILGLNTTVQNVLQFLNLAELGIGAAVAFTLYKPITLGDRGQITDIISLQGYFYRKIALFMLVASVVLVGFFPWIFAKADVDGWYPYATFLVMLVGILGSYVFNYRQVLLSADQKEYKILTAQQSIRVIKTLLQICLIIFFPRWGYPLWLVLELLGSVLTVLMINRTVDKEYPWLKPDLRRGKELKRQYPVVLIKTKQLFFHRIGIFALDYATVPIIYAYSSLTVAANYGNYMLIVFGVNMLVYAVYTSMHAGLGTLVAEGNKDRIMGVFRELFSSRFLLVAIMCFAMWNLADAFISLWVGSEYVLGRMPLALIVASLFIQLTRGTTDMFINAYGLFHDVWAPIVMAVLQIGLSVLLGYFWGLAGALAGSFIALIVIFFIWKPILLFRHGFEQSMSGYVLMYAKHAVVLTVCWLAVTFVLRLVPVDAGASWGAFIGYGAIVVVTFGVLTGGLLLATEKGMRDFASRIMNIISKR